MAEPLADDFAYIRSRLAELEGEPKEAEQPKAWPDYTPVDSAYTPTPDVGSEIWGHYSAPEQDAAWPLPYVFVDGRFYRIGDARA